MRRLWGGLVFVLAALAVYLAVGMALPHWLPAHDWHPRGLYWQLKDYPLHPWLPVITSEPVELEVWTVAMAGEVRPGISQALHMAYVVQAFQRRHPQVTVRQRTFPAEAIKNELQRAALRGELPHVVSAPLALLPAHLPMTPLRPFVVEAQGPALPDTMLALLSDAAGDHRLWPRWYEPTHWLANARALGAAGVPVDEIQQRGWSWQAVAGAAEQLASAGYTPLVLRHDPSRSLAEFMAAAGVEPLSEPFGRGGLQELLDTLEALRQANHLREAGASGSLAAFWQGRAAILLPAGPGLYRHAHEQLMRLEHELVEQAVDVEPVLLPMPHLGEGGKLPVHPHVVGVPLKAWSAQREERRRQQSRQRLAVALAGSLTEPPALWPAAPLAAVPAHSAARAAWVTAAHLPAGQAEWLQEAGPLPLTLAPRLAHPYREPAAHDGGAPAGWRALDEWWAGERTTEELNELWQGEQGGARPAEP